MTEDWEKNFTARVAVQPAGGAPEMPIGEHEGQLFQGNLKFAFVDVAEIPAGYGIIPIEIHRENAYGFAALHLAVHDFEFALECFKRAQALGRPDAENVESKAFINAGVVAYARAFSGGVRGITLDPEVFVEAWNDEDLELHRYLFNLRQKHVAHSVNEFERCDPVGIIVVSPQWVMKEGVSGAGVTLLNFIGLNMQRLNKAIPHVELCIAFLNRKITDLRKIVHDEMKTDLADGWTMAPLMQMPDAKNIEKSRIQLPKLSKFWQWLTKTPSR